MWNTAALEVYDVKSSCSNRIFKRLWADARADVAAEHPSRSPIFDAQAWNGQWDAGRAPNSCYGRNSSKYVDYGGVLEELGFLKIQCPRPPAAWGGM
jgi:hypothetical protein